MDGSRPFNTSGLLDSLNFWAACGFTAAIFALWGAGGFGGNLAAKTFGDFTTIGFLLTAAAGVSALRSTSYPRLWLTGILAVLIALMGGNQPPALKVATAGYVLGFALITAGIVIFVFGELQYMTDENDKQLMAAVSATALAMCAPAIWGFSGAEKALVSAAVVTGFCAAIRSFRTNEYFRNNRRQFMKSDYLMYIIAGIGTGISLALNMLAITTLEAVLAASVFAVSATASVLIDKETDKSWRHYLSSAPATELVR